MCALFVLVKNKPTPKCILPFHYFFNEQRKNIKPIIKPSVRATVILNNAESLCISNVHMRIVLQGSLAVATRGHNVWDSSVACHFFSDIFLITMWHLGQIGLETVKLQQDSLSWQNINIHRATSVSLVDEQEKKLQSFIINMFRHI